MIKAKVSTDYKDIERIFAGGSIQKEIIKVWSTEADSYVFEAWRILEMEGPLPLTLKANGEPLIDYRIYGNTVQNGTPTPENPIIPIGCGERTENLFDMSFYEGRARITVSGNKATGTCDRFFNIRLQIPTELYGQKLTWSAFIKRPDSPNMVRLQTFDNIKYTYGNNVIGEGRSTVTFTATSTIRLYVNYGGTGSDTIELSNITLNSGSTAFPYEPYGYKLPILSDSAVTNIYLGEVQTTRRIKKLVLTGEENWTRTANNKCHYIDLTKGCPTDYLKSNIITVICSHYVGQTNTKSGSNEVNAGCVCFFTGGGYEMYIGETTITSAADFKSYLAAQYAAGTPVTVWYVLAEPETGIVNEPLMKIGDYSDTIDSTQTAVQIPTYKGTTVIDYDGEKHLLTSDGYELVDKNQNDFLLSGSTLRPSKMYIKYKGR